MRGDEPGESQPAAKEQKIRDSCNACSSQKIRCGKQRPKCSRCALKGLDCEYSYSKRTGQRQPRERRAVEQNAVPPGLPVAQPPTPPGSDSHSIFTMADDYMTSIPAYMPINPPTTYDDFSWMWNQTPQVTPQEETIMFQDTPQHHFDTAMDNYDCPMTNATSAPQSIPTTRSSNLSLSSESAHSSEFGPGPSEISRRSESLAGTGTTRSTSRGTKQRPPHDCARAALKVVVDLHVSNQGCQRAAEDSNSRRQRSADEARDVDAIVDHNRDAIVRIGKILDCPCSSEQDVLIVVYLAIYKVVSWYAAILGSDNMTKQHRPISALLDRVATKPIIMGSYVLDVTASRIVRAHVVLTQLKENVSPLVTRLSGIQEARATMESFASRSTSPQSESLIMPPGCEIDLISSNHRALQDQLNNIISAAESIKQS